MLKNIKVATVVYFSVSHRQCNDYTIYSAINEQRLRISIINAVVEASDTLGDKTNCTALTHISVSALVTSDQDEAAIKSRAATDASY